VFDIWNPTQPAAWDTTTAKRWLATALLKQQNYPQAEPLLLESYQEAIERIESAPAWGKNYPAAIAESLVELYTALGKPDEVATWQAERDRHQSPRRHPIQD
jgi:hypothetical protein